MRLLFPVCVFVAAAAAYSGPAAQDAPSPVRPAPALEQVSWRAAEERLTSAAVVVVPLGGAAVQHGPHLPLDTDRRLSRSLTERLGLDPAIVIAPALTYHHHGAFGEYPGTASLQMNTARDLTVDVIRSYARFGPRRFYLLQTSFMAQPALDAAAAVLSRDGLAVRYTDPRARLAPLLRTLERQPLGGHADELETSMMLHVDPSAVDMARAPREVLPASSPFLLTRRSGAPGTLSPSGAWGDATLATRDKGRVLMDALLTAVRQDIAVLRETPPPPAGAAAGGGAPAAGGRAGEGSSARPGECLPGDDRLIRGIGPAFTLAWANQDALRLASLWAPQGDMVHPDGFIEGSAQAILENRTALFMRPEYRGSRHGLYIGQIRCIAQDVAVADAKWDLRAVSSARGVTMPPAEGLSTLVLRRAAGTWQIEAYRYSMKPQVEGSPTVLPRPGFLGRDR